MLTDKNQPQVEARPDLLTDKIISKVLPLFFFFCLLVQVCIGQQKKANTLSKATTNDSINYCKNFLSYYSRFWMADSFGSNGFREVFVEQLKCKCSFLGTKWDSISNFLGQPNKKISDETGLLLIYKLTNYVGEENLYNRQLYIKIDKYGVVSSFNVFNPS